LPEATSAAFPLAPASGGLLPIPRARTGSSCRWH